MAGENTVKGLEICTVVLVGGRDFGRCPLAARLPAALWPIADRPALARLLDHLAEEGLSDVTVCCPGDVAADVTAMCRDSRLAVTLRVEELINGTGGCLRDAAPRDSQGPILVLSGSLAVPPSIAELVETHRAGGADLTMVFNPGTSDSAKPGPAAEIFLCQPQVLERIPCGGYSDIKEGVVPAILRAGGTVRPFVLSHSVGNFHDHTGYLEAVDTLFQSGRLVGLRDGTCEMSRQGPIYEGVEAVTHPGARICGPVLIGDHARILEGAVVMGPAMIGRNVVVGENSAVVKSVLWAGAVIGRGSQVRDSILDYRVSVPDHDCVVRRTASCEEGERVVDPAQAVPVGASRADRFLRSLGERLGLSPGQTALLSAGLAVLAALLWSYWPTMGELMDIWTRSDEYSSGMLVPFLAAYVVWSRRQEFGAIRLRSAILAGGAAIVATQALRTAGLFYMYQSAERLSLVLAVAALVLLMLGWRHLWKLAGVLVFLCLMLPWPNRVQQALAIPLQQWATGSAVFCLELGGWDILRDGNIIHIGDTSVAVAEACNGLRMITAFFVITGLVVLLTRREWWAKAVILISSLPIALLCNTLRLAVTSVAFTMIEGEGWRQGFHDYGGYAMMPLALGVVVVELWVLTRLTTLPVPIELAIVSRRQPQHVPDP
ncbi:MAG TPA: exosortase [Sedimentisphaerales bacterium]|nr:exosortase [Sedimentisphaerales bacterium]